MEHPVGTKAATIAAMTRGIDIDINPDRDVLSLKKIDGSWITAMNDIKKGSHCIAAAVEEKSIFYQNK